MKRNVINTRYAFTLPETMAAVILLAFITTSVWIVLERCSVAAINTTQQARAFEVARENMEMLLVADSLEETTEYGVSEKYPDIQWQTVIETFTEPVNSDTWAQAVCTAEYSNADGEIQTVELIHWLTNLTKQQLDKLKDQEEDLEEYIIETEAEAAEYAEVEIDDIRQWVANGMPTTDKEYYLTPWLDLYSDTDGKPTNEEKQEVLADYPEMANVGSSSRAKTPDTTGSSSTGNPDSTNNPDAINDPELQDALKKLGLQ